MNALPARIVFVVLLAATLLLCPGLTAAEQDTAPGTSLTDTNQQLLRNFLLLQDQLRAAQRAIEQAREDAQAESKRNAEMVAARLNLIEQSLNAQRQQQIESLQRTTRTMLTVVGLITGLGFIAVLFAGMIQARTMARLAEVSRQFQSLLPAPRTAPLHSTPLLGGPDNIESTPASHLLGAIDRLERRLEEMESSATGTPATANNHKSIGPAGNAQVSGLLSRGQGLLNANKPEEALEQFENALRLEPRNAEAWMKKGSALERMQRTEEAVKAYDEAIALDGSQATAYLFKAGVYNRQKKYAEALQCYEKALSAQQKSRVPTAVKV